MSCDLSCDLKSCIEALSSGKIHETQSATKSGSYRSQYNIAVLLYQNCQFMRCKQVLKTLFDSKVEEVPNCFGLHTRVAFIYIDCILKCCNGLSILDEQSMTVIETVFIKLDLVPLTLTRLALNGNRISYTDLDQVLVQLQSRNAKLYDIAQVLSVTVYVHILIYRCKVNIARGDFFAARKSIHGALELFRVYLLGVLQLPTIVLFDGLGETGAEQHVCGLLQDYCLCSPPPIEGSSVASLLSLTIRIKQMLSVGTVLCARVEHHLGNQTLVQLLLSEPALHAPPIITTSECAQILSNNTVELRNNEACVALRRREFHRAAALFNQALHAASESANCGMLRLVPGKTCYPQIELSQGGVISVRQGELAGVAVCGRLYNAGLALLKLNRPVDAFNHFNLALLLPGGVASPLADRPHIWLRLADCCLQSFLRTRKSSASALKVVPSVESIALGKSRRIYMNFQSHNTASNAPLTTVDDCAIGDLPLATSSKVDDDAPPPSCSLSSAVMYLSRALQNIEKVRMNANAKGLEVAPPLLLHRLEEDVLLRLTYALLQLGQLHEGLETARRLDLLTQTSGGAEVSQNRYLGACYLVELLCSLGRQDEAVDFLKKHCQLTSGQSADVLLGCELGRNSVLQTKSGVHQSFDTRLVIAAAALQVNKAIALLAKGMTSAALNVAEGALRACPQYCPALRCVLFIYLRQGRSRQALSVLNIFKQAAALP